MVPAPQKEGNIPMTKLSDTQAILLSAAGQRADGNILPLPGPLRGGAATKVVGALLTRGLIREHIVKRVVRSTSVPIAEQFSPSIRSRSQWPDTARSSASSRELADRRRRFGYRKPHVLLCSEGWTMNRADAVFTRSSDESGGHHLARAFSAMAATRLGSTLNV